MKKPLQVMAVGAGYFAQFHLQAWQRLPQVTLAAIVERNPAVHDQLRQQYPNAVITDSISSAATLIDADIIDIITPPETHLPLIRTAFEHSTNAIIICQKPFCGSIEKAQQATRLGLKLNRTIVVHENFRFQPWYTKIKSILEAGTLGRVLSANFRLRPGDGQGPDAYLSRQPYFQHMTRFLIHETGVHWIDVFRFLFGEPQALAADLRRLNPHIAGEDAGHFIFHYDNGLRAMFEGNRHLDHAADNTRLTMGEMLIEGTEATLSLNGNGEIHQRRHNSKTCEKIEFPLHNEGFGGDCVYHLQQHVIDHLINGTELHNRAADYLKNLDLEELVYQAARDGTTQPVTPLDITGNSTE